MKAGEEPARTCPAAPVIERVLSAVKLPPPLKGAVVEIVRAVVVQVAQANVPLLYVMGEVAAGVVQVMAAALPPPEVRKSPAPPAVAGKLKL